MTIDGVKLHVYRTQCRRTGVRAYTGTLWAVADSTGTIRVYTITFPTLELLEDVAHAITQAA